MFLNDEKHNSLLECFERLKKGCERLYDECEELIGEHAREVETKKRSRYYRRAGTRRIIR